MPSHSTTTAARGTDRARQLAAGTGLLAIAAAFALGLAARPAGASSEDAWQEFRTAVADTCAKLAEAPADATVTTEVNPFGSESYGVALVTVTLADGSADRMACIYDKKAKTAEITAPFLPPEQG